MDIIKIKNPEIHISTAKAYSIIEPHVPKNNLRDLIKKPIEYWKGKVNNDFEFPIFKLYPELFKQKENLYNQGAIYSSMSGSGSVIFGIFSA